jgi:glycosyltransferase involved in cell wall biosynthesis
MKIVFVTFGNFDGHATLKRATGMADPLLAAGHEVYLLLEDSPVNREKILLECPSAIVIWHHRGKSASVERREKQLSLDRLQPDVVWICGVGARNWMRKPHSKAVVLADHSELYSKVSADLPRKVFYWLLEWSYCISFDGHICASRYLVRFYKKRLSILARKSPVHYSPYAFHRNVMKLDVSGAEEVANRWSGKKIILYMGSFWTNYGFWDMLKAFEILSETRDDFVAVLAGRGPEKEKGIAWVKERNLEQYISIEGYVEEERLSAYFTAAHAFLSPLRDTIQDWARCPSKLFMYVPFQHPVVTCKIGEAAELFGEGGDYYTPNDVDSMVECLNEVLSGPGQSEAVNPKDHDYQARADAFLEWYGCNPNWNES